MSNYIPTIPINSSEHSCWQTIQRNLVYTRALKITVYRLCTMDSAHLKACIFSMRWLRWFTMRWFTMPRFSTSRVEKNCRSEIYELNIYWARIITRYIIDILYICVSINHRDYQSVSRPPYQRLKIDYQRGHRKRQHHLLRRRAPFRC